MSEIETCMICGKEFEQQKSGGAPICSQECADKVGK